MGIGLIAIAAAWADTESAIWYVDAPIIAVSIINTDGFIPDGNLQSLLKVQVGENFNVADIRSDLNTLYTLGSFSGVEVDLVNASLDDEAPTVQVIYRIKNAPKLNKIHISGISFTQKDRILDELNLSIGQVLYIQEFPILEQRIVNFLIQEGYQSALVNISHQWTVNDDIILNIHLQTGEKQKLAHVQMVNLPKGMWWKMRLLQSQLNLQKGDTVHLNQLTAAREQFREQLIAEGWLDANVRFVWGQSTKGQTLSIVFEPGIKVRFECSDSIQTNPLLKSMDDTQEMIDILGVTRGQISEKNLKRYQSDLTKWYQKKGFWEAVATIHSSTQDNIMTIHTSVTAGKQHLIGDIHFEGNHIFSNEELITTFMLDRKELNQDVFFRNQMVAGLEDIRQAYIAKGFLDVKVSHLEEILLDAPQSMTHQIDIQIEEGTQSQIGKIQFEGGIQELNSRFLESFQGAYQPNKIQLLKQEILVAYQELGYLYVTIDVKPMINRVQHMVDLRIVIHENEKVILRNLGIRGNHHTNRGLLEEVIPIEVGMPITPSLLEETRQNLYDLNLFDGIQVDLSSDTLDQQDLLIYLDEIPNWSFRTGVILATDVGGLGTMSVQRRNIKGLGHQANLLGQFGYSWSDDVWQFDTAAPVWRLASTYSANRLPFSFTTINADAIFQEIVQQPNYRMIRSGMGAGLTVHPNEVFNMLIEYRIRRMQLADVAPGLLIDGEAWDNLDLDQDYRWWSGIQGTMVIDYRNDPFNPTEGWVLSGEGRFGDGLINALPTVRLSGNLTTMSPIGDFRSKLSFSWGIVRTQDDSPPPLEERFFLGGSNTMRGFARNHVGPANQELWSDFNFPSEMENLVDEQWKQYNTTHWVSTGGDSFAMLNFELHYPLHSLGLDSASVIAFTDIGRLQYISQQVITDSILQGTDPLLRYSVGVGFRYATVVGPLALDIGFNPSKLDERGEVWIIPNVSLGSF